MIVQFDARHIWGCRVSPSTRGILLLVSDGAFQCPANEGMCPWCVDARVVAATAAVEHFVLKVSVD